MTTHFPGLILALELTVTTNTNNSPIPTQQFSFKYMFREWRRVARSVHVKNLYCRFCKRVGAFQPLLSTKIVVPIQLFILFSRGSKKSSPQTPHSSFISVDFCIVEFVLDLIMHDTFDTRC